MRYLGLFVDSASPCAHSMRLVVLKSPLISIAFRLGRLLIPAMRYSSRTLLLRPMVHTIFWSAGASSAARKVTVVMGPPSSRGRGS